MESEEARHICLMPEKLTGKEGVLFGVSIAVKRHHEHGNSSKGKRLVGWLTYSSEIQSFVHHGGICAGAENSTS